MKKEIVMYFLTRTVPLFILLWAVHTFGSKYLPDSSGWLYAQKLAAALFGIYLGTSAANRVRSILNRYKNLKRILIFIAALVLVPGILSAASAKRIISLLPSNTEILFDLGAGEDIVGVSSFCDYPEAAKHKEVAGDLLHPNIEKVVSLRPDVVIAGIWEGSSTVPRLQNLNIKTVEIRTPVTLHDIGETVLEIGRLVGREKEAETLVQNMRKKITSLRAKNLSRKSLPTVYIEIDPPNWTVTSQSFVSDAVEICGTRNIFRDLKASAVQVSWEAVIEKDPDIILLIKGTIEDILKRPGASNLSAIKNGCVIENFGNGSLNRPVPRIVSSMEELSKKLETFKTR